MLPDKIAKPNPKYRARRQAREGILKFKRHLAAVAPERAAKRLSRQRAD